MKERIKLIMDAEKLTPAQFADLLKIGRAVISHILNGRNKPSLEVVTRILSEFSFINPEWLISGKGNMYKKNEEYEENNYSDSFQPDLFSQNPIKPSVDKENLKYENLNELKTTLNRGQEALNERIIYRERPAKKISKIIIYYSDNTYEIFDPQ